MTEDDHAWLRAFAGAGASADEAKVLIYARETGAVDNSACRDFCGLDTLAASQVLRRLRDRGLLEKEGSGSRTYYVLAQPDAAPRVSPAQLALDIETASPETTASAYGDSADPHMPAPQSPPAGQMEIPPELHQRIRAAGKKPRQAVVRELILALCSLRPCTANDLARVLGDRDPGELKRLHLKPLREAGQLALKYPETEKHPHQAYLTVRD